jgi:hypothetical protein
VNQNIRVDVTPRDEMDLKRLAVALLAIARSLPENEQDRLAAEGAVIAERLGLYADHRKHPKNKGAAA